MAVFMSAPGGEADAIGGEADIGARPGGHDDFVIADALAVWLGASAGGVVTARGGRLGWALPCDTNVGFRG